MYIKFKVSSNYSLAFRGISVGNRTSLKIQESDYFKSQYGVYLLVVGKRPVGIWGPPSLTWCDYIAVGLMLFIKLYFCMSLSFSVCNNIQ